jgi:hypothetical protein
MRGTPPFPRLWLRLRDPCFGIGSFISRGWPGPGPCEPRNDRFGGYSRRVCASALRILCLQPTPQQALDLFDQFLP